jgi:uncharacterized protein
MNEESDRWPAWYGPLALVIGLVVGTIGGVIAAAVIPGGIVNHSTLSPTATDIATLIQDLCFIGAAIFLAAQIARVRPSQFGLVVPRSPWRALGLLVAAGVLFVVVSDVYFTIVHSSGNENELVKEIGGDETGIGIVAVCALTTVIAPICEELLFRGFIFRSLSNWRGPWPAAIATGILFGVVHGLSAPAVDLAPLAFLGFALCGLYYLSGSLYPCIALHAINNVFALSSDEGWGTATTVGLLFGTLAAVVAVLALVRLASARWIPASD